MPHLILCLFISCPRSVGAQFNISFLHTLALRAGQFLRTLDVRANVMHQGLLTGPLTILRLAALTQPWSLIGQYHQSLVSDWSTSSSVLQTLNY